MSTGLPLLDWAPPSVPAIIIPFPLAKRTDKVRYVAGKLIAKTTRRHAEHYRRLVTEGLVTHLRARSVPREAWPGQLRLFWVAVDLEVARRLYTSQQPGGAA